MYAEARDVRALHGVHSTEYLVHRWGQKHFVLTLYFVLRTAYYAQRMGVVGERSNCGEALTVRSGGAIGSENVGLSSAQR